MTQQFSQTDIDSAVEAGSGVRSRGQLGLVPGAGHRVRGGRGRRGHRLPALLSTIATKIMLGWIRIVGGILMVMHAFSSLGWRGFLTSAVIGVLYVIAGARLAFFPFTGIITLTLLLAALFVAEGVLEVVMAVRVRPHEGWVWLLLSGIVAVAAGVLIALGLPNSATWAIGLLMGLNLLSTGASFIVLALAGRRADAATMAARSAMLGRKPSSSFAPVLCLLFANGQQTHSSFACDPEYNVSQSCRENVILLLRAIALPHARSEESRKCR